MIIRPCCGAKSQWPRHEVYLPHKKTCERWQVKGGYAVEREVGT